MENDGFEIYTDTAGEYRWRLRALGGEIIATSGEGFKSKAKCEYEVGRVKRRVYGNRFIPPYDQKTDWICFLTAVTVWSVVSLTFPLLLEVF